jgi:hypothetical protein
MLNVYDLEKPEMFCIPNQICGTPRQGFVNPIKLGLSLENQDECVPYACMVLHKSLPILVGQCTDVCRISFSSCSLLESLPKTLYNVLGISFNGWLCKN